MSYTNASRNEKKITTLPFRQLVPCFFQKKCLFDVFSLFSCRFNEEEKNCAHHDEINYGIDEVAYFNIADHHGRKIRISGDVAQDWGDNVVY